MTLQTIRADGVDWPFQTFLDAYGYIRVDRFIRPEIDGQRRVYIVDDAGAVRGPAYADQVSWNGIVAWRTLDPIQAPDACFLCGTSADKFDLCDECEASAEYED